ncbi:Arc family DNA-binding protein [Agrobacterium sp. rho-13.3]|uniref:Arc family DNA-binding protein n=1 Tax=Agrobacterium sp. rho-13.3 TaxID=3072980 RepID=UPI002A0F8BB0|nr:Arc family DNA-binding protein [Agrobacterium sp. rho-13.3]MDX8309390.1 Arc family DNA-binding protein [Agrobacterium sp. rho-13.3]
MTEETQMKIRLPKTLKEQIEASALEGNRSLNAEIVSRLQNSYPDVAWEAENRQRRAMKQTVLAGPTFIEREIETLRAQLRVEEGERVRVREEVAALISALEARIELLETHRSY